MLFISFLLLIGLWLFCRDA